MRRFQAFLLFVAMLVTVASTPVKAFADTFSYVFTTSDDSYFGNGELTVTGTEVNPGQFLIGSGSLMLYGSAQPARSSGVAGTLIPITDGNGNASSFFPGAVFSPSGGIYFDDMLYTSGGALLDSAGLLFSVGGTEFNISTNRNSISSGMGYSFYDTNVTRATGDFNLISESPVPEPTPLLLLGTGILTIVILRRKMKRRQVPLVHFCG